MKNDKGNNSELRKSRSARRLPLSEKIRLAAELTRTNKTIRFLAREHGVSAESVRKFRKNLKRGSAHILLHVDPTLRECLRLRFRARSGNKAAAERLMKDRRAARALQLEFEFDVRVYRPDGRLFF